MLSHLGYFVNRLVIATLLVVSFSLVVKAQTDQSIYTDSLQNNWVNYSWATVNFDNSATVHSGTKSVSVNSGGYQAIYLHHDAFSTDNFVSISFWIHGGTSGGQRLQVQATSGGAAQTAFALQPLMANTWQQVSIPLSSLGVGAGSQMDGFWIQETSGATLPVYYVDDITLVGGIPTPPPPNQNVTIQIDANLNRHLINSDIYGVAFATPAQLLDLNAPLNRYGGNSATRYNWQLNADNKGNDFYFQSIPYLNVAGEIGDTFIRDTKKGGAQPLITVPMVDWVAKLGPNRSKLASFSIAKYGAQTGNDANYFPDAGNGIRTNGQRITGNDPNDANTPNSPAFQQSWIQHLTQTWGTSSNGGVRYYVLDNEHSLWHETHRDVQPTGANMEQVFAKMRDYAAMIKSVDANAQVLGPEEWGWNGYLYSGFDLQVAGNNGYTSFPDRAAHNNMIYVTWLLQQFKADEITRGKRLLDVFSLHYYPQGGEFSNDASAAMQLRRNRSTRSLWDANYTDESYINDKVRLVPRMKEWVAQYYPNTKTALTEYNWGAENHINGATAQADVYGILGRENIDAATRWTTPDATSPTYKAMKMYRNYDGKKSGFGETSISTVVPNPNNLSSFAAIRNSDGALTIMVINKIAGETPITVNLTNFNAGNVAQAWQLTSTNQINRLNDVTGSTNNVLKTTVPSQSVTLFVVPKTSPTAAGVNLGGRVTTISGRGISKAIITMIDVNGGQRTALSNFAGNYNFANVPAGETYLLTVTGRRYLFSTEPRVIKALADENNINFAAMK